MAKIRGLAAHKSCTPGQLALAWVLAQGRDIIPIPGTKRQKYVEENAGAVDIELTTAEISEVTPLPAGRYYISTTGGRRFRIERIVSRDPYLTADVEFLDEDGDESPDCVVNN